MAGGHRLQFPGGYVEILPMEQDDLGPVVQLTRKLMEPLLRTGFGFHWDLRLERAMMADLMRQPVALVIRREGTFIGYTALNPARPQAKLHALMIEPAHQSQGIGTAMLRLLEERAAGLRCREIATTVQPNNKQALEFFRARGYADAGADGVNALLRKSLIAMAEHA